MTTTAQRRMKARAAYGACQRLQFLDLTYNNFSVMTLGEVFRSLKQLQNLGLSADVVNRDDFASITDILLQNLFLQFENLTTYENGSLQNIKSKVVCIVVTNHATDEVLIADALSTFDDVQLAGITSSENYLTKVLRQKTSIKTSHLDITNFEMFWPELTDTVNVILQSSIKHLDIYMVTVLGHISPQTLSSVSHLQSFSMKQNNEIDSLPDHIPHLDALKELDLSFNRLLDIPDCNGLTNLQAFLLIGNSIHTPSMGFTDSCPGLREMDVGGNPFMCTCTLRDFAGLQQHHSIKLRRWPRAYSCRYPEAWSGKLLGDFHLPAISCNAGILAAAILCPAVTVAIATLVLCKRLDVPWYMRMTWQWTRAKHRARHPENLEGLHFHAFVSYSQHDADWVKGHLLPSLEECRTLRICQHERNFVPGKTIVENIVQCVERSYRCIFVLSSHFVRSEWCHYELYFAQHQRLSRGSDSLILILLEPLPQYLIPSKFHQLKAMMARRTYLEWPQDNNKRKLFWAHLRAALQASLPEAPDPETQPLLQEAPRE
ncbi:hypothetical protein JZ751_006102 [Albula glossodonta]|uniref:TIR domain-containing protein n=1 Tax=Albula glossodonta TaxID=121402 RepID=A0A8T2P3N5_9TELE|nr:hypothetical protein JZ751_006102 [Albula glossodonta]